MNIDKFIETVSYEERQCNDIDLHNVIDLCEKQAQSIESVLKQVVTGTRITGKALDKFTPPQLKSLLSTLFDELQKSKERFEWIYNGKILTAVDLMDSLPGEVFRPIIEHLKSSVRLDDRFDKVNSFIDNAGPSLDRLLNIEQSCNELKNQVSMLSDLKNALEPSTNPLPELTQHHMSQMKELENIRSVISNSPPPPPPIIDWSHIKFPPLPKVPQQTTTIRNEVRLSQDVQMRKRNVILRGLTLPADQPNDPLSAGKSFLKHCGIEDYQHFQKDLESAFFLNKTDGKCTIRMVFNNHWTVDHILESAYKLKTGSELYCRVYLAKDRTEEEMKEHREPVSELKLRIRDQPTTRWAIQNGQIVNKGHFTRPT